jgi:hypothetical protein
VSAATVTCALCGARFDGDAAGCRPSCPLAGGCGVVCCPRCGYSFPREDRGLAGLLKRALVTLGKSAKEARR